MSCYLRAHEEAALQLTRPSWLRLPHVRRPRVPQRVRDFLTWDVSCWLLPTPATYLFNLLRVRSPTEMPELPPAEWSRRERRELLTGSEDRLRNLEGKGPGLATISAVITAAVLVALTTGWHESRGFARIILVIATVYAVLSLIMPLYLVGPLKREAVHVGALADAAEADDPEEDLAQAAATSAMNQDLRNLRVANLLEAARRELTYALVLLVVWLILVPGTAALKRGYDHHQSHAAHRGRVEARQSR